MTVSLERALASRVRFGQYRMTFLPRPGCVAERVEVTRDGGAAPVATVDRLAIEGSWLDLITLTHRLTVVKPDGLHVNMARDIPRAMHLHPPAKYETMVGTFVGHGTVLTVGRSEFHFNRLLAHDVAKSQTIRFQTAMRLPDPPGQVEARGTFGPWRGMKTPVTGSFRLMNANLGKYGGLEGILEGNGKLEGVLEQIHVKGGTSVANFRVRPKGPAIPIEAQYAATVNGVSGETHLHRVDVRFLRTNLVLTGTAGKTTSLHFDGQNSRMEDLLQLFASAAEPAMYGLIGLQANVILPPGNTPFLRRLQLDGNFGIDDAKFKARTQRKIDELSSRARTEAEDDAPPDRVTCDLKGRVVMRDGIARLSDVQFRVPGALAAGGGTFNVETKQVDLRGTVAMEASLSEAADGGVKSFLLKPLDIFFRGRKRKKGAVLPVRIAGKVPGAKATVSLTR